MVSSVVLCSARHTGRGLTIFEHVHSAGCDTSCPRTLCGIYPGIDCLPDALLSGTGIPDFTLLSGVNLLSGAFDPNVLMGAVETSTCSSDYLPIYALGDLESSTGQWSMHWAGLDFESVDNVKQACGNALELKPDETTAAGAPSSYYLAAGSEGPSDEALCLITKPCDEVVVLVGASGMTRVTTDSAADC